MPLKIYDGKILVASGKFPSFGRKAIFLNEIKKIKITTSRKWDEAKWVLEFIRVEDIYGNKYRNVIYLSNGFKQIIRNLLDENIIKDESWLKDLFEKSR